MAWTRMIAAAALMGATLGGAPALAEARTDGAELANAELRIGSVMAVVTQAEVSGAVGARKLQVGTPVYSGDLVETDLGGEVQLRFSDGTRMVLGPGSSLILEEYVFRGDAATNKFAVRALGGAFRFITGVGNSENYSILTPNAKIGVRGTVVEFFVDRQSGQTDVRLREGEAAVCDEEGEDCKEIVTPCGFVQVRDEDDPELVEDEEELKKLSESPQARYFDENEEKFEEDFRVVGAVTCLAVAGGVGFGAAALAGAAAVGAAALAAGGGSASPAQ